MNIRDSISYFVLLGCTVGALLLSIYSISKSYEIEKEVRMVEEIKIQTADTGNVEAKEDDVVTEGFYLMSENGYVVVYLHDEITVFEKTNILVSNLDYALQQELENGKYIQTVQELYGFLENYSS